MLDALGRQPAALVRQHRGVPVLRVAVAGDEERGGALEVTHATRVCRVAQARSKARQAAPRHPARSPWAAGTMVGIRWKVSRACTATRRGSSSTSPERARLPPTSTRLSPVSVVLVTLAVASTSTAVAQTAPAAGSP